MNILGIGIDHYNYTCLILIFSGILTLIVDVRRDESSQESKDLKVARSFGWFHLLVGIVGVICAWFF